MDNKISAWMPYGYVEESVQEFIQEFDILSSVEEEMDRYDFDFTEEDIADMVQEIIEEKIKVGGLTDYQKAGMKATKKSKKIGGAVITGALAAVDAASAIKNARDKKKAKKAKEESYEYDLEDFDITEEELMIMVEEEVAKTKSQLARKKKQAKLNKKERAKAAGTSVAMMEKSSRKKAKKYRKKNRVSLERSAKKYERSAAGKKAKKLASNR